MFVWRIEAGTECEVRPVGVSEWRPHRTARALRFRCPPAVVLGLATYHRDGWVIRLPAAGVVEVRELDAVPAKPPGPARKGRGASRRRARAVVNRAKDTEDGKAA
ncbi:unnamed protein product [Gemmataceae bacterium]|nr:unnamed protein product [Gemmataceae bacterium]VTT97587.1 unnamed protein product [Gemmataceae bacterium]